MDHESNSLGQPIGKTVAHWKPCPLPGREPMEGRTCHLEPADLDRHVGDLWQASSADEENSMWTYLAYGPFATEKDYRRWMAATCLGGDPLFYALIDAVGGRALGMASYLRIQPESGVIEVGHIQYSPKLRRTTAATEAMYLMMRRVFDELGYRRYEWKCDALNARSRRAAERLGFRFEGIFRQASVYKGRNRDTAWYSITDAEWPGLKAAMKKWLDPRNFDEAGVQRKALGTLAIG